MKIGQILKENNSTLSFEFFPPKEKVGEERLFKNICILENLKPDFVSVTYGAGGGTSKNTFNVIKRIKQETQLVPMPHITCINQSDDELKSILEGYRDIGIENVLAMRGDIPEVDGKPIELKEKPCHGDHMVKLAASVSDFSIGAAGYPEGHLESPNIETDIKYTKLKVDTGADFIITQMFFDNQHYYDFLERTAQAGITVPIIPGIMPITDIDRIKTFCAKCGATLPEGIKQRFEKAGSTKEDIKKTSIETVTEQCADLMAHGVRYLHFFTLNQSEIVSQVVANLNLQKKQVEKFKKTYAGAANNI